MKPATSLALVAIVSFISVNSLGVAAQYGGCKDYYSKGSRAPAIETVTDVISVSDGFPVGEISVTLDVSHRRIGALVVSLSAQPPTWAGSDVATRRVVLKERGLGRLGDNMYMTTFSDASQDAFPVAAEAAPFRGVFKPTQRLSFLHDEAATGFTIAGAGGSQGDWKLRIDDIAPNATIRPIALNGWMVRLCPISSDQTDVALPPVDVPTVIATPFTTPPSPPPAPAPTPSPSTMFNGWQMITNTGNGIGLNSFDIPTGPVQVETFTGYTGPTTTPPTPVPSPSPTTTTPTTTTTITTTPPTPTPTTTTTQIPVYIPPTYQPTGLQMFQNNFNSYLRGRFGNYCTDPTCANVKAKFWRAALGFAYLRGRLSGKIDPSDLVDKLADLIPGPDSKLSKLSDAVSKWEVKSTDLLRSLSGWYDKVQHYMAGHTQGLEALLSSASGGGEGLRAFGIDPSAAMSALGPLLGLDNADDAKALMDGLNEAGFEDLMKDFLDPSAFMFRRR